MKYELKSVGEGYFILSWQTLLKTTLFSIKDYHSSGDYTDLLKFKKTDALKLQRFLNHFCKNKLTTVHWKLYDRINKHLNLETSLYAE